MSCFTAACNPNISQHYPKSSEALLFGVTQQFPAYMGYHNGVHHHMHVDMCTNISIHVKGKPFIWFSDIPIITISITRLLKWSTLQETFYSSHTNLIQKKKKKKIIQVTSFEIWITLTLILRYSG